MISRFYFKCKLSFSGLSLLVTIGLSMMLSSCFTGIESTKKIHLSREDRRLANPTAEENFMIPVSATPLKDWQQDKSFIVSDNKALLVIIPQQGIFPVAPDSIKGKILHYFSVEPKINAAGDVTLSILFSDGAFTYAYDTGKTFNDAMENVMSNQIPMLIDEEMVNEAARLLVNKKIWIRSPLWYDEKGNRINGKKFIPVTILNVKPGNMVFPLNIEFVAEDSQNAYVFMNLGNSDTESRSFHNLFSLTDPKKHYPGIDEDTWQLIIRGEVQPGMSKEECRLALGNPIDLSSGHDYSQTLDIWTFENGKVLWFEDGRLTRIRQ